MASVFVLWHYKIGQDEQADPDKIAQAAKDLGTYSSEAAARSAMERRRREEGFRDWSGGFRIVEMPVNGTAGNVAMPAGARIFAVWHFRIAPNDEEDFDDPEQSPVELGIYATEDDALAAVDAAKTRAEFLSFPGGFRVLSEPLDIDHWKGGFVPRNEA